MKTYGKKLVEQRKVLQTRCDNCGKVANEDPEEWVSLHYGHDDWGNDSIESWKELDACSAGCLLSLLKKISEEYKVPVYGFKENRKPQPTLRVIFMDSLKYDVVKALGELEIPV